MRGVALAFWCCVVFSLNVQFSLIPMPHLFIWTPLACIFILVGTQKEDDFSQVFKFLFLYFLISITFSTAFGLHYVFGLRKLLLS